ncbi:MAG TPA: NlpC/P60 family protein [Miltoncostaeaceae bacterium]|nr:NlpC/P60 family protein [Miltoncostaeaceae bacterium]
MSAQAEPASIAAKRAELGQIQSEVAAIDNQLELAAEAYNGARYNLIRINGRIEENRRVLKRTINQLGLARTHLAHRVLDIYRQPRPSTVEVILSSPSISQALDDIHALDRVRAADGSLVTELHTYKVVVVATRKQLLGDQQQAKVEVARRAHEEAVVAGLLAQRRAVMQSVQGDLARMLAAEQARQARLAAIARARALAAMERQREIAVAQTAAPSGGGQGQATPAAGAVGASGLGSVVAPPAGTGANSAAASDALKFLGTPYVWGGAAPGGFDCSGLASYVYGKLGISVPHFTGAIWSKFPKVPESNLQAGDLVFFNGGGHVGIYLGGGQFVHAPHTGDVVKVSSLSSHGGYVGAVRP